jgi:Ni/Co efflux regulator RcnB
MRKLHAAGFAVALLIATTVSAQQHSQQTDRRDRQATTEQRTQFNDHDRQVTTEWYKQHQNNAPSGFRSQDRLSAQQEARLQPGRVLPQDLRRKTHAVPSALRRQLPPAPRNHEYVVIGGHVVLVDSRTHSVRDVIRLH